MEQTFIRNLSTSEKNGCTRIFLEPTVLEQAGLKAGDRFDVILENDHIRIVKDVNGKYVVSRRKLRARKKKEQQEISLFSSCNSSDTLHEAEVIGRPLIDICNKDISTVLRAKERIDIIVSDGELIIRHERSFSLTVVEKNSKEVTTLEEKITVFSAPCGGGFATSALVDTGFYQSVGGVDIDENSVATYLENFRNGQMYWGDIRRMHTDYIPKAHTVWLSPPCTEYSNLGKMTMGVTEGLSLHFARMVYATGCEVVMIEQVPNYFNSRSYYHLKKTLTAIGFPY